MFKVKNNMAPSIFNNNIKTITHIYPTKYLMINFNEPLKTTKYSKYAISTNDLQSRTKMIWTTAKTALFLTPQAMYNQFKRPSAGSVRELYYIYRKT